ncbi:carbon starvation CstA family protein [Helicobacter kayseriensis]|uniref:carbon starvation CstA family protein n=1 Tax=Helicobacter kayseriensis TaxID=2905877 RepID=UPI001E622B97|nr:carbon starvation protein A [Helicobacter kayseriensis]MCE3047348.1 carbon starvation protein A [Helicobacter kayseriensis]MCE3048719.1 carbon starvation protein A [Helicobacter kayseriensis]
MNALILLVIGLVAFGFGWFIYSKFVASKILKLDANFSTPSHTMRDEVDYIPTHKFVLWGHHFTAVAGAAPIVGPAIAVQWGWMPAFFWVVLGTIFFAGVHDMGALWASVRHQGQSIGGVCRKIVGSKVGQLFMIVIFLVLLMVNSAFGVIIANESVAYPSTIIPAWGAIFVAIFMGISIYHFRLNLGIVTLIGVVALYGLIPLGNVIPISLPAEFLGFNAYQQWIIILFLYAGVASIMPVWLLLQPRDYINGIQLFIGLILLYSSIFLVAPAVVAPKLIPSITQEGGWQILIPVLFITVACGAISGFHGIVASGTTSKQVDKETDVRFVGYLGALGEGSLALGTIIACIAGLGLINPDLSVDTWASLYKGGAANFSLGGAAILHSGLGIPQSLGQTLLSLMVILFAATTMDAGIRLQRYIVQEWGELYKIHFLKNKWVSTLVAVGLCFSLSWSGLGEGGQNEVAIWPLFGATNQILASLTLLTLGVILIQNKRIKGSLVVLIPMSFILCMSLWGALIKMKDYYTQESYLLFVISFIVIVVTISVVLSALSCISKILRSKHA